MKTAPLDGYWMAHAVPKGTRKKCISWIMWQESRYPEVTSRSMWDSPDVLRSAMQESGAWMEFQDRDGGSIFVAYRLF